MRQGAGFSSICEFFARGKELFYSLFTKLPNNSWWSIRGFHITATESQTSELTQMWYCSFVCLIQTYLQPHTAHIGVGLSVSSSVYDTHKACILSYSAYSVSSWCDIKIGCDEGLPTARIGARDIYPVRVRKGCVHIFTIYYHLK